MRKWPRRRRNFSTTARPPEQVLDNELSGDNDEPCPSSLVSPGPNSHFFTADASECAWLKQIQAQTPAGQPRWNYEEIAFAIDVPANGSCPASAPVPIYRVYNNRAAQNDSNHRYATDTTVYQQMIGQGWKGEGVVMCAPS